MTDKDIDIRKEANEYFKLKSEVESMSMDKLVNKIKKSLTPQEKDYLKQLFEKNDE